MSSFLFDKLLQLIYDEVESFQILFGVEIGGFVFINNGEISCVDCDSLFSFLSTLLFGFFILNHQISLSLILLNTGRFDIREFGWIEFLFYEIVFEHGFHLIF